MFYYITHLIVSYLVMNVVTPTMLIYVPRRSAVMVRCYGPLQMVRCYDTKRYLNSLKSILIYSSLKLSALLRKVICLWVIMWRQA